jgi:hypothetical protein
MPKVARRKRKKIHEPYMKFKGWLREKELTYTDISKLLDCTIGTVSDKVNGFSDFLLSEIEEIVDTYGAEYKFFLGIGCENDNK